MINFLLFLLGLNNKHWVLTPFIRRNNIFTAFQNNLLVNYFWIPQCSKMNRNLCICSNSFVKCVKIFIFKFSKICTFSFSHVLKVSPYKTTLIWVRLPFCLLCSLPFYLSHRYVSVVDKYIWYLNFYYQGIIC